MPHSVNSRPTRRSRLLRYAAGAAVLLGLGTYATTVLTPDGTAPARCFARQADAEHGTEYALEPVQAANAATITAVASQRELPERAVTIAIATAIQESSLRNISHGDRDSLGLFQQRPSQGWGTAKQIQDPVYSAGKFYDHLVDIPGYSRLPLTVAAQRVQRSGFPQAYAKHEADASLLAAALTGRRAASLTCTSGPNTGQAKGELGEVRERLVRDFGTDVLPVHALSAGATRGAGADDGADDTGTEFTVPAPHAKRGWEVAHWAVAHAEEFGIARIAYADHVWSAERSDDGWRTEDAQAQDGPGGGRSAGADVVRVRLDG